MDIVTDFKGRLMSLDPSKVDFVTNVDELLESVSPEFHEKLIPAFFGFFEKYPLEDCGAPGSLVHLTEHFYPRYKPTLLESLVRAPSYNAILMTHRILNSQLAQNDRDEYMTALRSISNNSNIHPILVSHAQHFIEHQQKRQG
jgi:hypothetical protein